MLLDAVAGAAAELLERPARLGDADDRHVEAAAPDHRLQRREDLLVGEVAGGAEEDERVGPLWGFHQPRCSYTQRGSRVNMVGGLTGGTRGESLAAARPRRGSPVEEGEDRLQRASMDGGAIDVGLAIVADIVDVARESHGLG